MGWQSVIRRGKIPWNTLPLLGIEPGPQGYAQLQKDCTPITGLASNTFACWEDQRVIKKLKMGKLNSMFLNTHIAENCHRMRRSLSFLPRRGSSMSDSSEEVKPERDRGILIELWLGIGQLLPSTSLNHQHSLQAASCKLSKALLASFDSKHRPQHTCYLTYAILSQHNKTASWVLIKSQLYYRHCLVFWCNAVKVSTVH